MYSEDKEYDLCIAEKEAESGIIGYCTHCRKPLYNGEAKRHRDGTFCEECFDALRSKVCDCCGMPILEDYDDYMEADGFAFCEDCMDKNYTLCECCGGLIVEGDKCLTIELKDAKIHFCEACISRKKYGIYKSEAI